MSLRDRLLPAALIVILGSLSACAGTPTIASNNNGPADIQFASVEANQSLPPSGPEIGIHGVAYRTSAAH